jgi:signal peptidase II
MNRLKYIRIIVVVFILNFGFDRLGKYLAEIFFKDRAPIQIVGNLFILTYTENSGAFLSFGSNLQIIGKYIGFLIIPIIACFGALYYVMCHEKIIYRVVLITTIVSGGMGNLVDRLINQFRVIDFMNFGIGRVRTGILNIADLSITFGVLILLLMEMKISKNDGKSKNV